MAHPIWKDKYVTLGTATYLDYTIEVGGYQVFAGRAYSRSGSAEPLAVKVNDIVADYLERGTPNWAAELAAAIPTITAVVKVGGTAVDTTEYYNDWSYDLDYVREVDGLAKPIDGWVANGQHLLFTTMGNWTPTMRVTYMGERGDFQPWLGSGNGSFNNDFFISGWWQDVTLNNNGLTGQRVFCLDLSQYADLYKVTICGKTWKIWPGCCRYVLHYLNAYGGWDSLLIRGNGKQTDTLKRYTRKVPYHNGTSTARGTENYVNEMGAKYELHPGTMTEAQAARMPHLLNSPEVYLEDMQEGRIFPVVLTNTTSEHKTWANQGHKLVEYTIECELAQDRLRR